MSKVVETQRGKGKVNVFCAFHKHKIVDEAGGSGGEMLDLEDVF